MTTMYYSLMTIPETNVTPNWMREERYQYCDQSAPELRHGKGTSIWSRIKKVFS